MRAAVLALAILLAACGGGGGGGAPTAVTGTAPPVVAPPVAPLVLPSAVEVLLEDMRARAAAASPLSVSVAPPTITPGVANAASTIPGGVLVPWSSGKFFYTGHVVTAGAIYPDNLMGASRTVKYTSTAVSSNYLEIEFSTDAPVLEVWVKGTGYSGRMRFVVDGKLASAAPVEYPAAGSLFLTRVDFGSRATRRIRILANDPNFGGVRIAPGDTLTLPPSDSGFRAMFLGDSVTEASAGQLAESSYAAVAAQLLGWSDAWVSGVGATGYLAAPGGSFTFRQRFDTDVKPYAPKVLVIAGGINDGGFTDAQIQAEAGLLFDRIRTELPDTLVFVLGPWNPRSAIRPGVNTALKAAASGRPNFYWVPNVDDAWITGTGYVGHEHFDGNSDWVISADSTHPSPAGIDYLAGKVAAAVKALIQ